jgi:RNA polymerase-binding transcription factor DksA
MQARMDTYKTGPRRSLLCRMRELLLAGNRTPSVERELLGVDDALRRIEAEAWDPCPRCGKRIHV